MTCELRNTPALAYLTLLAALSFTLQPLWAEEVMKAKALVPGDKIAFVAPASPLNRERIMLAKERLEGMGFVVSLPDDLFRANDYLAGSEEQRRIELMAAFADPEVKAIFPGTGGYGTTRILDQLDYDLIRRNPKVFIGFSDITALHIAIQQRTGLITFHSPNPEWGLGSPEGLEKISERTFWRAILASTYVGPTTNAGYLLQVEPTDGDVPAPVALVGGVTEGRTIGGNLSLVHALMGTPNEIETKGRILFLEDVGEAPYRVDRMLQTMKSAGLLSEPAGVILGAFTRRKNEDTEGEELTIDDVLAEYFKDAPYPVLQHFPLGHQRNNSTLPVGVRVRLDANRGAVLLLEDPVALPN